MPFPQLFRRSLYSPSFYRSIPLQSWRFSLRYYLTLTLVLSVVTTVLVSAYAIPAAQPILRGLESSLAEQSGVLDGHELNIRGGRVTLVPSDPPVRFSMSDAMRRALPEEFIQKADSLLVIDTLQPFSEKAFWDLRSLAWLSSDQLAMMNISGQVQTESLAQLPDQVFRPADVRTIADRIGTLADWLAPVAVFGVFLATLISLLGALVYLLVGALIIWAIAYFRHLGLSYISAYQVSLHAATLGLVIWTAESLFLPELPIPHPVFFLLLALTAWVNLVPGIQAHIDSDPET
ncbi:MAG: DUF1189 family protein [Candidatus Liptonbacteria bacterium]|nr:DUF1189 family protein [Candidatus Liptonbacteria bacterium]